VQLVQLVTKAQLDYLVTRVFLELGVYLVTKVTKAHKVPLVTKDSLALLEFLD
jgi:hypothetical protein